MTRTWASGSQPNGGNYGTSDHQEGIVDDETHAFFTRLMDEAGAMLWGRITYEMMESYWPAVARGDVEAPPVVREWAVKLEAMPKYVVSSTRTDFPWTNTHHITDDLHTGVQKLKEATPNGVLLGSGKLAAELELISTTPLGNSVIALHYRLPERVALKCPRPSKSILVRLGFRPFPKLLT